MKRGNLIYTVIIILFTIMVSCKNEKLFTESRYGHLRKVPVAQSPQCTVDSPQLAKDEKKTIKTDDIIKNVTQSSTEVAQSNTEIVKRNTEKKVNIRKPVIGDVIKKIDRKLFSSNVTETYGSKQSAVGSRQTGTDENTLQQIINKIKALSDYPPEKLLLFGVVILLAVLLLILLSPVILVLFMIVLFAILLLALIHLLI